MKGFCLSFSAPRRVDVRESELPDPAEDELLVETICSGISAGTELLIYRDQFPRGLPVDETIPSLAGKFGYPMKYGYDCVGRVIGQGKKVSGRREGQTVFAFNPHESHFLARPQYVTPLPEGLLPEEALFLPSLETALNLLMDGGPLIGEETAVFGQGVVGLLTTALLARCPLARLVTFDLHPLRRGMSLESGAHESLDPSAEGVSDRFFVTGDTGPRGGFDLVYELSGNPAALDHAIRSTGFGGRVIIGSWYGRKTVNLDLGGSFHRSRIRLVSSQVSTIAPEHQGRWTKERRSRLAWGLLRDLRTARLVTHRIAFERASEAYVLLDNRPEECLQVILTYGAA